MKIHFQYEAVRLLTVYMLLGNLLVSGQQEVTTAGGMGPLHQEHSAEFLPRMSEEKKLCRSLMANYTLVGLNGRPVVNTSRPTVVDFGLGLIQMDLDERNKILSTSMWARYKWNDEYLRWDPSQFSGVRSIKLLSNFIWKPDIMLYNTAETDKAEREVLAVVGYDGTVLWVPHQIFKSSCSIDVTNFPFDYQECAMFFGSWTYSIEDVDPQLAFDSGIDLSTFMSDYKESCSWEIVNNTAERKALPEEDPTYVVLSFTLKMRRKMVFSTYILTLPCVFLATLTLVVFWLPPDRPDRTSLAMSIFASFLVLLLILVEAAPPTASSVPTLGVYYCFNMVIIMMSIFLSTLVVNVCRGGDYRQRVPKWLNFLTMRVMSRILCVHGQVKVMVNFRSGQGYPLTGSTMDESYHLLGNHGSHVKHETAPSLLTSRDVTCENGSAFALQAEVGVNGKAKQHQQKFHLFLGRLLSEFRVMMMKNSLQEMAMSLTSRFQAEDRRREAAIEWKCLALVMDRTFFYLYLCAIIVSLVLLFPRPRY